MTTAMKAAFTLTLEDKLTSGLQAIQKAMQGLRETGSALTLGKLERGGDVLRAVVSEARSLASSLNTVGATADRAWGSLRRMASGAANWGRHTFGPNGRVGALQGALAGYSVYGPLESAAELSNTLRHSAITAHQYGPDADRMMAQQRAAYTATALETAQGSHSIAEAGFWLALTGMNQTLVDKLSPLSAKIATAYNTAVSDAAKTAFGLNYSMKIGEPDMERALGMMAILGKHGHYLFADQAKSMPMVAAAAQMSHMTGMGSLEQIGAAMQISMKVVDPAQPAMAATNLEQFLRQIQSAREDKVFEKYHVDIAGVLMDAAGKGISPMEAAIAKIKQIQDNEARRLHITDPAKRDQSDTEVLNHLLRSQEASRFASAMLHNLEEYKHLKELAHGVDTDMIGRDFAEAMRDLNAETKSFHEELTQITDRMGFGFAPVLRAVNWGLRQVIHGVEWLDKKFPGLGDGALAFAGGLLVLTAALAAIGFIAPAVAAGFGVLAGVFGALLTPIGLVAAAIAALAVGGLLIYENWDTVQPVLARASKAFDDFVGLVMTKGHTGLMDVLWGISDAWDAMIGKIMGWEVVQTAITGLSDLFDTLKTAAKSAFDLLDGWTGGTLTEVLKAIGSALDAIVHGFDRISEGIGAREAVEALGPQPANSRDEYGRPVMPQPGPPGHQQVEITVHAEPGTRAAVTRVDPGVRVRLPDPGRTVDRP